MYVIVDLEATCWAEKNREKMETIEIGAVKLSDDLQVVDEFNSFIKPVVEPTLSDYCRELTSITQEQVDEAETFAVVFPRFVEWVGSKAALCSWGNYDNNQLLMDCARCGIVYNFGGTHINLKQMFATEGYKKHCGMKKALKILHIPLEGTHHRAIDDVKNIAKIAQVLFRGGRAINTKLTGKIWMILKQDRDSREAIKAGGVGYVARAIEAHFADLVAEFATAEKHL